MPFLYALKKEGEKVFGHSSLCGLIFYSVNTEWDSVLTADSTVTLPALSTGGCSEGKQSSLVSRDFFLLFPLMFFQAIGKFFS